MKRAFILLLALCLLLPALSLADAEDQAVWQLPNKSSARSKGLYKTKVTTVAQVTGEDSPNKTLSRYNVGGTDLGSLAELNGKVYMFCGDTFAANGDEWRCNVLFIIEDDDPSDGLTITGAITDRTGSARELLPKLNGTSRIPTNIFAVGDTLYCIYMHTTYWDSKGGVWECSHSGLAKSEDEGETWKMVDAVQWPGDSNFIQTANCQVGDIMYIWGIPTGRFGGVALMKCNVNELEDPEAYSYFTGCDDSGDPQWVKGSEGIHQAQVIINAPVGEISVMYNEYLGNFVLTYLHEGSGVVMREGIAPWGEWSMEFMLASLSNFWSPYGGFMLPKYVEENGRVFYFTMSKFSPYYNIYWMRAELP